MSDLPQHPDEFTIAYDTELCRPACVLIQAGLATIPTGLIHKYFPTETWLVAPSDNLRIYKITKDQLPALAAKTIANWKPHPSSDD